MATEREAAAASWSRRRGRDPHRRIAGMQHAALIAAIMAAVTFAIMFLFDLPWLGAAVVVFSGIA